MGGRLTPVLEHQVALAALFLPRSFVFMAAHFDDPSRAVWPVRRCKRRRQQLGSARV